MLRGLRLLLLSAAAAAACGEASAPAPVAPVAGEDAQDASAPGTRSMAARLAQLAEQGDPMDNPYRNDERAAILERRVARSGAEKRGQLVRLIVELLLAGRTEEAIARAEPLYAQTTGHPGDPSSEDALAARRLLALACLRLGEQQNCLEHHGADSCLVPIRGDGVHVRSEGSERALELLGQALDEDPDDWEARWLYNLAAMTLGRWPDGVPPGWRIPEQAFASEADWPRMPDVAVAAGVAALGQAGGVCMEDLDGDGLLDLLVSSWGVDDPLRLFVNRGDGGFDEVSSAAGLDGLTGGLNLVHADPDNDGDADVLVLRGGWFGEEGRLPNSLLRNDGGRFEDATEELGLLSLHPTQTAAWGDVDGDGWLDLFIGNESGQEDHPCELFMNDGTGRFLDRAPAAGADVTAFVKGTAFGDVDNDGDLDLFVSCLGSANRLLRNDDGRFVDVAAAAGVEEPRMSFPAWFFDADNDGWLDLFVSGYRDGSVAAVARDVAGLPHDGVTARFYRNRGDGSFSDDSAAAGLSRVLVTMGSNFGDVDNDGWSDLYLGTGEPDLAALYPNRMFRNGSGERFLDATTASGTGHVQKGHGVAFGDLDQDGDQDLYAVMGGAYSGDEYPNALFENPGHGKRWITLRLVGREANRAAIGARIRVRITEQDEDGAPRSRDIHATVGTGGSFGSSSLQQEIGLGDALAIESLGIQWPGSGTVQSFEDVPLDGIYTVVEGEEAPRPVERRAFELGG